MSLETSLLQKIDNTTALLHAIATQYPPVTFANSFGAEDMVLTDLICQHVPGIEMFSIDTGRLPEETYRLMQEVKRRYGISIQVYFPNEAAVERYLRAHGPNAFYESIELRKACCYVRKVEPLRRALAGKRAWITGLRWEQAPTRRDLPVQEWDADNRLQKFNPLLEWTQADVWDYLRRFGVPYNTLHDSGYPSIGCGPCTRAVAPGQDIRAGRWWWEEPSGKECGLHCGDRAADKSSSGAASGRKKFLAMEGDG